MADDRARIFEALAAARAAQGDATPYPDWDTELAVAGGRLTGADLAADFRRNLEAAAGLTFADVESLAGHLEAAGARAGYCDPALPATLLEVLAARFTLHTAVDRTVLETLDFGVTRATAGVAETGSMLLTDRDTPDRLAAVATWIHVAVLDPAAIVPGVEDALALAADDPYAVLVTGPSQTADVEGILIRGVHGPGEQVCLLLPPAVG